MTRIIIRAMPERSAAVLYLRRNLPDAELCFDRVRNARETFERSLAMAQDDPHINMEEDIVLTRDFRTKIEAEIAARPQTLIQFFSLRKDEASHWDNNYSMSQCTYFPAGYAASALKYSSGWFDWHPEHPTGYDLMIRGWLQSRREKYWLHVPSLVDHRVGPSLINPRRSGKRTSPSFTDAIPWP